MTRIGFLEGIANDFEVIIRPVGETAFINIGASQDDIGIASLLLSSETDPILVEFDIETKYLAIVDEPVSSKRGGDTIGY